MKLKILYWMQTERVPRETNLFALNNKKVETLKVRMNGSNPSGFVVIVILSHFSHRRIPRRHPWPQEQHNDSSGNRAKAATLQEDVSSP
jgi:hypothetical protein